MCSVCRIDPCGGSDFCGVPNSWLWKGHLTFTQQTVSLEKLIIAVTKHTEFKVKNNTPHMTIQWTTTTNVLTKSFHFEKSKMVATQNGKNLKWQTPTDNYNETK